MNSTAHIMSLCSVSVKHDVLCESIIHAGIRNQGNMRIFRAMLCACYGNILNTFKLLVHIIIAMHNNLYNLHVHTFANSCTAVDCESLPQTSVNLTSTVMLPISVEMGHLMYTLLSVLVMECGSLTLTLLSIDVVYLVYILPLAIYTLCYTGISQHTQR